jgi:hypothetical protein
MLTDKAKRYHQVLDEQISNDKTLPDDVRKRNEAIRAALRRQLPSNVFVQFLAGPKDLRDKPFGYLLRFIAWVTLVVAPVLLLLMMQIQFLPFHSRFIAWTQRRALLADLVLIWWLWRKILGANAWPVLGAALIVGGCRGSLCPRRVAVLVDDRDLSRRTAGGGLGDVATCFREPSVRASGRQSGRATELVHGGVDRDLPQSGRAVRELGVDESSVAA